MLRTIVALVLMLAGSAHAETVYLHCGWLLDRPGAEPRREATVVVEDDMIVRVSDGYAQPAAGVEVIDLRDKFVLPGLIDCHTHITHELGPMSQRLKEMVTQGTPHRAIMGTVYAERTLMAGFTTIRNVGANGGADLALRDMIAAGFVPGPRILTAGATISVTGGHGDRTNMVWRELEEQLPTSEYIADGPDECREAVRQQIKWGADLIKITATGGVLSATGAGVDQQFFDDELAALVETAHSMKRKIAAHAHGTDGINAALRAGVDSVEHGTYLDSESIELFRSTGAYLVPTMHAGKTVADLAAMPGYFTPAIKSKAEAVGPQLASAVERAHKAGVKIAFGTDMGVGPHGRNAEEFGLMVEAGLSPMETIVCATRNAADLCGLSENLGSIEPGKWADIIAVDQDPLDDVSALMSMSFVMKAGEVYKNE